MTNLATSRLLVALLAFIVLSACADFEGQEIGGNEHRAVMPSLRARVNFSREDSARTRFGLDIGLEGTRGEFDYNAGTNTVSIEGTPVSGTVDAEFTINRKDFGMIYKGKADNLINDLVVIKLSLKLKKKG